MGRRRMKRLRQFSLILLALVLSVTAAEALSWRAIRVSIGTSSASQVGNTAGRTSICFKNLDSTNPIYCGPTSSVTSSTGTPIAPDDRYCTEGPDASLAIYCIATGSTVAVGGRENVQ